MTPDLRGRLEPYLASRLGARAARILDWRLASQGLSDETIFVRLGLDPGDARELVIRRYRARGVLREFTDPERHFRVLHALQGSPIPVPATLWFESDAELLGGAFFVMERVHGTVPVPWSREGRAFLEEAGKGPIGDQFVDILAAIHRVDRHTAELSFLRPPDPGRAFALGEVTRLSTLVDRYKDEPEPIFADALGWMRENAPPCPVTTLVHGDYRTTDRCSHRG